MPIVALNAERRGQRLYVGVLLSHAFRRDSDKTTVLDIAPLPIADRRGPKEMEGDDRKVSMAVCLFVIRSGRLVKHAPRTYQYAI